MYIEIHKKPKESKELPANSFGQLRSYLAQRKYSQEWIKQVIGDKVDKRSRSEIYTLLKEALKNDNL